MCGFRNMHSPPTEGIGISWEGGSLRPKKIKKCTRLIWNFPEGWGVLEKNPFPGGGMDIFWNYTITLVLKLKTFAEFKST